MIFEIKLEENIPLEYSEDIVKQLYLVDDSILNIKLDKKDLSLLLVETKLFNQQTLSSIKSVAQELIKNFILFPAMIVFEDNPLIIVVYK